MVGLLKIIKDLRKNHKKKTELNGLYWQRYNGPVLGTPLEGWKNKWNQ